MDDIFIVDVVEEKGSDKGDAQKRTPNHNLGNPTERGSLVVGFAFAGQLSVEVVGPRIEVDAFGRSHRQWLCRSS